MQGVSLWDRLQPWMAAAEPTWMYLRRVPEWHTLWPRLGWIDNIGNASTHRSSRGRHQSSLARNQSSVRSSPVSKLSRGK